MDAARKRLAALERPRVAVAAADEEARVAVADALDPIAPGLRCERLASAEELELALAREPLDLVVLDLGLAGADPLGPSFAAVLAELEAASPRPAIVVTHHGALASANRQALERHERVRGVVALDENDRVVKLIEACAGALTWTAERRAAAAARFAEGDPCGAYRSGDLAGPAREGLQAAIEAALPSLKDADALEALRVAIADRYDQLDEVGVVYHATTLRDRFPAHAGEAGAWLERAEGLIGRVYGLVDLELEAALVQRRLGNFPRVLEACVAVKARLGSVYPAYALEAEALRMLGRLDEAIEVYHQLAELSLRNGEVERFYQVLRTIAALDPDGAQAARVGAARSRAQKLEDEHADPARIPRYPALRVCSHGLCQEAAEASGGFFAVDATLDGRCDICDLGLLRAEDRQVLAGLTVAVIGGRLPAAYERALYELGAREVRVHADAEDAQGVPALIQGADGVVLVTGSCAHGVTVRAERELARHPRPYVRVHFYGAKQVARAAALDLAPRLRAAAVT
ncbi:MAG: hypothetical protein JWM80_2956 [Cyanobacteria bacterium RYN_339]|nr:hypothetical protein [Cyanobacteria bacterium RYN_339]